MGYNTFAEKLQKTDSPDRFSLAGTQFHYLKKDGTVKYTLDLNAVIQGPEVCSLSRVIYWIAKNIFCCFFDDQADEDKFTHLSYFIYEEIQKASPDDNLDASVHVDAEVQFTQCKSLFKNLNPTSSSDVATFVQELDHLAKGIYQREPDKQLLNDILNFKNEVRAACIDKKIKPLKGGYTEGNTLLGEDDQRSLKASLRRVRRATLKGFFAKRLQEDRETIKSLEECFAEKKREFNEQKWFLANYLSKLKRKNNEGKPIALPKYFHCTRKEDTLEKILNSYILFAQRNAAGCFVSIRPEFNGYGKYCIALSERIEKTGTKNPGSKDVVYPQFGNHVRIKFQEGWVKRKHFTDHNEEILLWIGFQRGKATLQIPADGSIPMGTDGIPLKCHEKIASCSPLKSYADTSVAYIVGREEDLSDLAKKYRVDCLTFVQEEALRSLIGMTFKMTLPSTWAKSLGA